MPDLLGFIGFAHKVYRVLAKDMPDLAGFIGFAHKVYRVCRV